MHSLEIKGNTYELAEGWNEVTLAQFKKLYNVEITTPYRTHIERFKILVKPEIDDNLISSFDIGSFGNIINMMSFVTIAPSDKIDRKVVINKIEYSMLDSLEAISIGEWADLEFYINKADGIITNELENILAILVRPTGEKYNGKSEERSKLYLENMTADYAMSFLGFFLTLEVLFIKHTLADLIKKTMTKEEMEMPLTEYLEKIGDGLDLSMSLQKTS